MVERKYACDIGCLIHPFLPELSVTDEALRPCRGGAAHYGTVSGDVLIPSMCDQFVEVQVHGN